MKVDEGTLGSIVSARDMTSFSWSEDRRIDPGEVVEEEKSVELHNMAVVTTSASGLCLVPELGSSRFQAGKVAFYLFNRQSVGVSQVSAP